MAVVAPSNHVQIPARQMSSDFMARRKIYEHEEQPIFYSAVAKVTATKSASDKFSNATPKPVQRKEQACPASVEALPQTISAEPAATSNRRFSDEGRPYVPKRSSSIRTKQSRKSRGSRELRPAQLFSSLDESVNHDNHAAVEAEIGTSPAFEVAQGSTNDIQVFPTIPNETGHSIMTSEIREDSPLGFTLARKRTSLPLADSVLERSMSARISKIVERDSCISHRDRESFLASFPQPPKSAVPKAVYTHRRNSSSQNYSLFPRPSTKHSNTAEEGTPRQSMSQRPLNMEVVGVVGSPMPSVEPVQYDNGSFEARPGQNVQLMPLSPHSFEHHDMSFSSPNFSNVSLHLQLNAHPRGPAAWTSTTPALEEHTSVDGARPTRKRSVRKGPTRWLFGSMGTNRNALAERLSDEDLSEKVPFSSDHRLSLSMDRDYQGRTDAQFVDYSQKQSNPGIRKKASSLFKLEKQPAAASTSNLLDVQRSGPGRLKKSILRRMICF